MFLIIKLNKIKIIDNIIIWYEVLKFLKYEVFLYIVLICIVKCS